MQRYTNDMRCEERGVALRRLRRIEVEALLALHFLDDERVELLDGVLVTIRPPITVHTIVNARIAGMLMGQLGPPWTILQHCYLTLGEFSMPEPDVVVLAIPRPIDVHAGCVPIRTQGRASPAPLVVEVSDVTFCTDATVKAALYAQHAIPTYWLVDLVRSVVRVHELPRDGRYTAIDERGLDGVLTAGELPEVALPIGEVLALM